MSEEASHGRSLKMDERKKAQPRERILRTRCLLSVYVDAVVTG